MSKCYFIIRMLKYICVNYQNKGNSDTNHVLKDNDSVFESGLLNNRVSDVTDKAS